MYFLCWIWLSVWSCHFSHWIELCVMRVKLYLFWVINYSNKNCSATVTAETYWVLLRRNNLMKVLKYWRTWSWQSLKSFWDSYCVFFKWFSFECVVWSDWSSDEIWFCLLIWECFFQEYFSIISEHLFRFSSDSQIFSESE